MDDPSTVLFVDNLSGSPADGIVDDTGALQGSYTSFLGARGHQLQQAIVAARSPWAWALPSLRTSLDVQSSTSDGTAFRRTRCNATFCEMTSARAAQRSRHRYTYQEYLAYERDSGLKHEYEDGEILAMAGGTRRHNALASRISAALEAGRKPGCVAFQSDQKVRVLTTGKATYPDASMVCGPIEGDPADPSGHTITNPVLIVEVLSASTEEDDRGNKWQHYQLLESLEEYVLVSQTHPRVEWYRRVASGAWEYRDVTEGTVVLQRGAAIDLAWLYADLPD